MKKKYYETEADGRQKAEQSGSRHTRKRATGILAAVLAVLILLSGTFAWYYVTNAINEFGGKREQESDNSAVLHDDFDKSGEKQANNSIRQ